MSNRQAILTENRIVDATVESARTVFVKRCMAESIDQLHYTPNMRRRPI